MRLAITGVLAAATLCASAAEMEFLTVSKDNTSFVGATSGAKFIPWGFNYDRDYKMRLIEEYWTNEWQTVEEDFSEMKSLGANVVRIHPQFTKFMDAADKPNAKSLEQLDRLLALAEKTGLYLDITGLACFRKADVPRWYNDATEEQRWAAQACFWEAIAQRCAKSPAVFFYDLMNEPIVPGGKRKPGEWLGGELGGFSYVQFISLDQAGRERPQIARQWIAKLVSAIRKHDPKHLISVGLLPNGALSGFPAKEVAPEVDFICVHVYPDGKKPDEAMKTVESFAAGKPLIIEETFPMQCSAEQLGQFIHDSSKHAAGWIGFYWGKSPEQLRQSKDIGDAIVLSWLELFQKANPNRATQK